MSYIIKKAAHITDEVRIQDADQELVLNVNIYIDDIMERFEDCRRKIVAAQQKILDLKRSKAPEETVDETQASLRVAIMALFELIFGKEQTERLLQYYDGRHVSMLSDFLPYIVNTILPGVQEAQKGLAERYSKWNR